MKSVIQRSAIVWLLALTGGIAIAAEPAGDAFKQLPTVDFGSGEEVLTAITTEVTSAKLADYPAIEKKLLASLQAGNATVASRQFACRMLRIVGSAQSVPVLANLLQDEKLSHMARYALYGIKDASADQALRDALAKTSGNVRIGIVNSLGDRRDAQAVAPLAKLLTGSDDATMVATTRAIGKIGTKEAAAVLLQVKLPDSIAAAGYDARLICGHALADAGQAADAKAVFASMLGAPVPPLVRAAALGGTVKVDRVAALPAVIEALKSESKHLRQGAAAAAIELREPAAAEAFAKELPSLPALAKVTLLNALVARGSGQGLTATINKLTADEDAAVRSAAVAALKQLGDASSVAVLADLMGARKEMAGEIVATLKGLYAQGVAEELMKKAQAGPVEVRAAVIEVLGDRRDAAALPMIVGFAAAPDKAIRIAAIKALGSLATEKEITAMLKVLAGTADAGERDALANSIGNAAKRNEDIENRSAPIIKALDGADPAVQVQIVNILKALGGNKSLDAVRKCLASSNADVKKAAVRSMADWVDAAPMNDLKALAKSGADEGEKILALRGFIRAIGLPKNRKASEAVPLYKEAMDLATRTQEKVQVIGGLGNIKDVAALKAVQAYFADAALKTEAMSAAIKIADGIGNRGLKDSKPILQQVMEQAPRPDLKDRAKTTLEKISR